MMPFTIRPMSQADAPAVAELMPVLGYSGDAASIAQRLLGLMQFSESAVFVAEHAGDVLALCHAQGVRRIDSDGYCEILTLVVKQDRQRRGIGRALLAHATTWAWALGHTRIRLGSGVHREEAHRFYEVLGFEKSKPGYVFHRYR